MGATPSLEVFHSALAWAAKTDSRFERSKTQLLQPSAGGVSVTARVSARGGVFYLKLRSDPADDAAQERRTLSALSRSDFPAPRVAFSVSARRVLPSAHAGALLALTEVRGRAADAFGETHLQELGATLAHLHTRRANGVRPLGGGAVAPAIITYLEHALAPATVLVSRRHGDALARRVREARAHVERSWMHDDVERVICHGDLRPANVLFDGDAAGLIDFEHAGLADPMVDLMRLVVRSSLNRHQELCLLDAYAAATGVDHLERYFLYRPLGPLFLALSAARGLTRQRVAVNGWRARAKAGAERALSLCLGESVAVRA